jgi:hypothetical protein
MTKITDNLSATNYTIDNIIFSIILNGVNFFFFICCYSSLAYSLNHPKIQTSSSFIHQLNKRKQTFIQVELMRAISIQFGHYG